MIKVIAFDADDTLWHNENLFQEAEREFCLLLENYLPVHTTERELLQTEIRNIGLYGYGIKAFMLSMIETAIRISDKTLPVTAVERIIAIGQELLQKPVALIDGVEEVLITASRKHRLVMATKGDLLDQERKLQKSGLAQYFHHIEIMSDKQESNYRKLLAHLDIEPSEFLMVGNSVKSDIIPVVNIGSQAIHVPFEVTWQHETHHSPAENINYVTISKISQLPAHL